MKLNIKSYEFINLGVDFGVHRVRVHYGGGVHVPALPDEEGPHEAPGQGQQEEGQQEQQGRQRGRRGRQRQTVVGDFAPWKHAILSQGKNHVMPGYPQD